MRAVRHWVMARATDAALRIAPCLSDRTIQRIQKVMAFSGMHLPVVSRIVADNMRSVGLYTPQAHRAYFIHVAAHLGGALHTLRCAGQSPSKARGHDLAAVVENRFEVDETVAGVQEAASRGKGVIVMTPHISDYMLSLACVNRQVPVTVFSRYSKGAGSREAKLRWYRAAGLGWIMEPPGEGGSIGRLGSMAAALEEGRVLFISPDLAMRREAGTPVRFFDREIYLPAGAAMLAARTGAPLFTMVTAQSGDRQRLHFHGPFGCDVSPRGREARRAVLQQQIQWFASCFEAFLREHTSLWYLWGDKRWTRAFRNDPRYVGPASATTPLDPPGDA